MKYPARLLLAAATLVVASSAHAATITLFNGNFEGGTNGSPDYDPNNWTVTENTTNNEIYAVAGLNGFTSTLLHFKDGPNTSILQNLTANNAGVTADTYGSYTVSLDIGWRTDISGAAATFRFSLVDVTNANAVLGFTDYTLALRTPTQNNVYTLGTAGLPIDIAYDNTAGSLIGHNIGLQITRTDAADAGTVNESVVWMDNLSITAVPEPSTYGLLGAGALAAVALVRRRRRVAGKVA